MTNHPYPDAVRDAVAAEYRDEAMSHFSESQPAWEEIHEFTKDKFRKSADRILAALWDASRVHGLEQVDPLPDDAILWGADDMEHDKFTLHVADINNVLYKALPAHVIFWGDHDDR